MAKKKTHEEFVEQLNKVHGEGTYIPLEKYKGANTKIKVRHNKCDHEWEITPSSLLQGNGCPKCAGVSKKTHEEFIEDIKNKYGNEYSVLGEYINAKTKVLVKHNKCGYKWEITPSKLLGRQVCPVCGKIKIGEKLRKTHKKFIQEIKNKYCGEYIVLGNYDNSATKIKVRHNCKKCNYHEWKTTPNRLLNGQSCPVCNGREAKLGINTIWDTDRWMCDLGVSEEDAKKYSKGSHKTIMVKCPDCGREKEITIRDVNRCESIGCSCGDGKSYPEKFVFNLLEQLDVDFETEYKPKWIDNKRYDFYIPELKCIIETHGMQHYDGGFERTGGRTLEEELANDKYKRETALTNGIKHYVELDCRESNLEWIKNSILNSELNKLFNLSTIDWTSCVEFSNKNIVKKVCEYWNNRKEDKGVSDLAKEFKLSVTTIRNYLKKGNKFGWCDYDTKKERERGRKKANLNVSKIISKRTEIFKDNQSLGVFESCTELSRLSEELFGVKLFNVYISDICRGKRKQYKGFTFKYVEEDNNLNISKIA